mgnify:CR=1 FL=1
MTVDIICPLYNAEKYIEELHKSFEEQESVDINKVRYVITKGKDNTIEKVQKLNCDYEIIESKDFSHSLTREKQAFKSEADIIVFVTQDVIIKRKDWLSNLVQPIINNECDASYSRQICDNNTIEKYTRESNYPKVSRIVSNADIDTLGLKAFFFSDASSAIKRETFVKLNGYDGKKFPTNEDMYIAYKLITNGYKIKYCADSEVIHSHKFTFRQQYERYYDTGRFFKQNKFLNKYKVNKTGGSLARYVLKRAWQDKNWSVIVNFLPNMVARYIGMKMGEKF